MTTTNTLPLTAVARVYRASTREIPGFRFCSLNVPANSLKALIVGRRVVERCALSAFGILLVLSTINSSICYGGDSIAGTLSNFDVWNRSTEKANDFHVTLGGILPDQVTDLWTGDYDVEEKSDIDIGGEPGTLITWRSSTGRTTQPDEQAHFGFEITGNANPTSVKMEWTFDGVPIPGGSIPDASQVWNQLQSPLDADFDEDGVVSGDDFLLWQSGFGIPSGALKIDGDADLDGDVDGDDFLVWQSQFGSAAAIAVEDVITNNSEEDVSIQRRWNTSPFSVDLGALLSDGELWLTGFTLDDQPIQLNPGSEASFTFDQITDGAAFIGYDGFLDSLGGEPIIRFLNAANVEIVDVSETAAVPEPSTFALSALAFLAVLCPVFRMRRT